MRLGEADTLPALLGELDDEDPDVPALIHGATTVTFAELAERAARLAGGLGEIGIAAGDRVALWLPNRPEWLELHFALARLGAVTVAVNTRFRAHEVRDLLARTRAKALAFAPGFKGIASRRSPATRKRR
jgi:fatty-acyl-CoA synthase